MLRTGIWGTQTTPCPLAMLSRMQIRMLPSYSINFASRCVCLCCSRCICKIKSIIYLQKAIFHQPSNLVLMKENSPKQSLFTVWSGLRDSSGVIISISRMGCGDVGQFLFFLGTNIGNLSQICLLPYISLCIISQVIQNISTVRKRSEVSCHQKPPRQLFFLGLNKGTNGHRFKLWVPKQE